MALRLGVERALAAAVAGLEDELRMAMAGATDELERAADDVLSHRAGVEGGMHRASAPGEPPALRTGAYRDSWRAQGVDEERTDGVLTLRAVLTTSMPERARALEYGGGGIQPRPHFGRILEQAADAVRARL